MNWQITISDDNAAFEDGPATEIARILRVLADDMENGRVLLEPAAPRALRDINGNEVGQIVGYANPRL